MKRLKSLTRAQKKELSKRGCNPEEWQYAGIGEDEIFIIAKERT